MRLPTLTLIGCAMIAGCFSPSVDDGGLVCEAGTNACPPGFHCAVDGTCWHDGRDPSIDLGVAANDLAAGDLAIGDLAGADLQSLDLAGSDLALPVAQLIATGNICQGAGNCAVSLGTASAPGDLLVLTFAVGGNATPTNIGAPWMQAALLPASAESVGIWYYPNNPGGISSITVNTGTTNAVRGQMTEWRGVTMLDRGATASAASTTALTVATSAPPAASLGVTATAEKLSLSNPVTFTIGSGWMSLGDDGASSAGLHTTASYFLAPPSGAALSNTVSTNRSGDWAGAIATFR
jgi:hypothetical protein